MEFVDRYLKLSIWPPESSEPVVFNRDWKITFRIRKNAGTDIGNLNQAEISIYNLNENFRSLLSGLRLSYNNDLAGLSYVQPEFLERISLVAGYKDKKGTIFEGLVQNVTTVKRGPDLITTFYCASNTVNYAQPFNECVQNTPVSELIKRICGAHNIPCELNFSRPDNVNYSFSGTVGKALSYLCYTYKLSMGQENGVLVFRDKDVSPEQFAESESIIFSPTTGLLGNPTQTFVGMNFRAFINPDLRINDYFTLYAPFSDYNLDDLTLNPQLVVGNQNNVPSRINTQTYNGTYLCLSMVITGDTRGDAWEMDVEGSGVVANTREEQK